MLVKIENGLVAQFPYTLKQMRIDYASVSLPKNPSKETLESFGVFPVSEEEAPSFDPKTQRIDHALYPTLVNGVWVRVKSVVNKTDTQITADTESEAIQVRRDRNDLLSASDWTQVADAPVDKAAWATYRQALRDVTSQTGFPWEVTWPSKPE